ncbi:MAG: hypothetical protein WBK46_09380 [Ruminococcus flavefaciens]
MGLIRKYKRIKRAVGALAVGIIAVTAGIGSNFYKEAKVDERNRATGDIARSISGSVRKFEQQKREEYMAEMQKKKREKFAERKEAVENSADFADGFDSFSEQSDAFMNGDISFDDLWKQKEEEFKEQTESDGDNKSDESDSFFDDFAETPEFEMKGEYYIFGTVDKSGCYAEPCELFDERERLISVDPSEVAYNWAVFVKDSNVVEAWTSTDTLTEADLRPYTKEEQKKQFGSIKGGKAENIAGYWNTPFEY